MDHAKAVACYCKDGKKMTSVMCMAVAIALEARVEPVSGIGAVADVIMTRVADPRYPDTVCGVVLDKGEFPWNANGLPSATVGGEDWRVVQDIAADAIASDRRWIVATHYHTNSVSPYWAAHYTEVASVGRHVFYYNQTKWR